MNKFSDFKMTSNSEETSSVKNGLTEQSQDEEYVDLEPLGNPTPPPDIDLDQLRGDRIGDTVYSGKWCIQTVMKLMQSNVVLKCEASDNTEDMTAVVDMEEELQNEVGALWDMTINMDVCLYLHSVGAVQSICYIITNSRCPRATEMCVGMLANIITHPELWMILHGEIAIFNILIQLLANTDQPVLLEVTRFFNTALYHVDNIQCYTCLCESGSLITQELMRILSGSMNANLLKQTAELTYNLMSLDERETFFCALFADADFISSLLEAAREFGFEHETSGQSYIMAVFHYYTTYEAGLSAIENMMEQIAETSTCYFKLLCQNLNLSKNINVIISIVATLNHIFCRHMMVRVRLMSSPSFIHCVLKTLVAVYRKLGYYKSMVHPRGQNTTHFSKSWKTEENLATQMKASDDASWSERANVTSVFNAQITPDGSPSQVYENKELENSWSERRISSPFDGCTKETWKMPSEKKRLKRREGVKNNDKSNIGGKVSSVLKSGRKTHGDLESEIDSTSATCDVGCTLNEQTHVADFIKSQDGTSVSRRQHKDSFSVLDKVIKSSKPKEQMLLEAHDIGGKKVEQVIRHSSKDCGREVLKQAETSQSGSIKSDDINVASFTSANESIGDESNSHSRMTDNRIHDPSAQISPDRDHNVLMLSEENESLLMAGDDPHKSNNVDHEEGCKFKDIDKGDMAGNFDGFTGDKYHKLLVALTEFLKDYFNNLRETATREDGKPYIHNVVVYLNTQCSIAEIRALVMCVGTSTSITQPLGRLLHICDHFKAKHLKSLLLDCVKCNP